MKVAICYNGDIRDNGTAFYCRRALEQAEGIESVFVRSPSAKVPKADCYISIDDGRDDISWIPPRPNAFWAIDTHLGYEFRLWKAKQFDRSYTAQKDAAAQFCREGLTCDWLPLACSPEHHPSVRELAEAGVDVEKIFNVAFVGFLNDTTGPGFNNRLEYLDRLFSEIPGCWLSTGVFHQEMAARFARSHVGFNVSIKNDLNMRVFEVLSTGTPLVTNRNVEGMCDLFEEGKHFVGYEGPEEMVDAVRFALAGGTSGSLGFSEVRSKHTYAHRMKRILEDLCSN